MHFFNIAIAGILLASPAIAGTSQTLTLDVQNMSCATCPITVKKALQRVPGVIDVKIDYERKTATVQLDSDNASVTILTKATTDAGFPSTARKVQ